MFYGIGSKRDLMEELAAFVSGKHPLVIIRGYQPALSLRHVLSGIVKKVRPSWLVCIPCVFYCAESPQLYPHLSSTSSSIGEQSQQLASRFQGTGNSFEAALDLANADSLLADLLEGKDDADPTYPLSSPAPEEVPTRDQPKRKRQRIQRPGMISSSLLTEDPGNNSDSEMDMALRQSVAEAAAVQVAAAATALRSPPRPPDGAVPMPSRPFKPSTDPAAGPGGVESHSTDKGNPKAVVSPSPSPSPAASPSSSGYGSGDSKETSEAVDEAWRNAVKYVKPSASGSKGTSSSLDFIFSGPPGSHLFLVIENIDGVALRTPEVRSAIM